MRPIGDHPRLPLTAPRLVTLVAAVVALGACSSGAAPAASTAAAPPTAAPVVTPTVTPSPTPSLAPSPTVAIVKITPIPGAPDSKIVVQLVAAHAKWDLSTLTAPAGKTWHVKIDNQETFLKHNFTVASGKTVAERIFQSPNFGFGTSAFDVPALPAGTYLFVCTIHPETMTGTLTIR